MTGCLTSCASDSTSLKDEQLERTTQRLNTSPQLQDFLIYAERSAQIGQYDLVGGGDIGVAAFAPTSFGSQLVIGAHAHIDASNLLAPSTTLGANTQVGDVQTGTLVNDGATSLGTVAPFPAGSMPATPLVGSKATSSNDVSIGAHQSTTLPPGSYGALTLADHASLTLEAGTYSFSNVTVGQYCQINADAGGSTVYVAGTMTLAGWDDVEPAGGATADKLVFLVDGSDGTGGSPPAVSVGLHSHLSALIAAPYGTLSIADHVLATGAFAGFDVVISDHTQLTFQSGFTQSALPNQHGTQQLTGYYGPPPDPTVAALAGPVPPSTTVLLSIGLPITDPAGLKAFISSVSDYTNPLYRKYKSISDFTTQFAPSSTDYGKVVTWAQGNNFDVWAQYSNNLLVDVYAAAGDVERALYSNLVYRFRADGTQFITVDRDPSVDLGVTLLQITGLDDYVLPSQQGGTGTAGGGTANYWGTDFREAYLGGPGSSCLSLDGTGQVIGLFELGSFQQSDISSYDTQSGLPQLNACPTSTSTKCSQTLIAAPPVFSPSYKPLEITADIQLAQSMAPGATVVVFDGTTGITNHGDSILHSMATYTTPAAQSLTVASSSWGFGWTKNSQQAVNEMAAQGVSYFQSSGDNGSNGDPTDCHDFENITLVGGTILTTGAPLSPAPTATYPAPYYSSEATWNDGNGATGGGIMSGTTQNCWPWPFCETDSTGLPGFQEGVDMSQNGGSTTARNWPDVAMDVYMDQVVNGNTGVFVGTSVSAPLFAGFMALANQQSAINGLGNVGYANPVIYAIGKTANEPAPNAYTLSFNDIADGVSNGNFTSVTGYDLTTGWGTPTCGLINQLAVNSPTAPATYDEIQIHISNGDDGIRDDSSAQLSVFVKGQSNPVITQVFHQQNDTGWNDDGVVHDLVYSFPTPVAVNAFDHIEFTLTSHDSGAETPDNWSIAGLNVRMTDATGVESCLIDQQAYQLGRLTNSNPTATFNAGGCSLVTPAPPAVPVTELEFIFDTGDDDLRQNSELDVAFYAPVSSGSGTCQTTPFEQGVLKPQGACGSPPSFDNDSQHNIYYQLTSGPHPLSDLCAVSVTLVSHDTCFGQNDDEWHVYGLNFMSEQHGSPQNCYNDTQGESLEVLNSSNPTMTIHRSGCP